MQSASRKYSEEGFLADIYMVIELNGDIIEVNLDEAKWTTVMDGQWKIQPAKPTVSQQL